MEQITARSNPLMAHIRRLNVDKTYRRSCGELVCEGPKLLEEALKNGAEISTILQTDTMQLPEGFAETVRCVCVPEGLLHFIADTKTPQGLLFLCRLPSLTPPTRLPEGAYLLLDGIQDPGNLGTIWRTADAFGAQALLLLPGCADPFAPKTIRAAMGASFRLPVWEMRLPQAHALLRAAALPLYAAALREDAQPLGAVSLGNAAVAIGSEGSGVSQELLALCDKSLKIPMRPRCESLNAAVAAAVVLWEMARANRAEPDTALCGREERDEWAR